MAACSLTRQAAMFRGNSTLSQLFLSMIQGGREKSGFHLEIIKIRVLKELK